MVLTGKVWEWYVGKSKVQNNLFLIANCYTIEQKGCATQTGERFAVCLYINIKGTSIKMSEIDPSHVKEITCLVVNTKKLVVVLEYLKDQTATVQIVYVRSSLCLLRGQLWNVDKGLLGLNKLFETFMFSPLYICSRCEAIFSQDIAKEGR